MNEKEEEEEEEEKEEEEKKPLRVVSSLESSLCDRLHGSSSSEGEVGV